VQSHYYDPYPKLARWYDLVAKVMLTPFGGERAFRSAAIEELAVEPRMSVLELGCGTGAMTRHLLDRGALVTAVDLSQHMLARARRRARGATFVQQDILEVRDVAIYDRVLVAFVLHEMDRATRRAALAVCRRAIAPHGLIGVLDFTRPPNAAAAHVLAAYLRISEPPSARELFHLGVENEIRDSGLRVERSIALARGTATIVIARP